MVGDTLLIFSAEWCFLGGLAAFLVGHIFYNILFVRSSLMPVLGVFCFATVGASPWVHVTSTIHCTTFADVHLKL